MKVYILFEWIDKGLDKGYWDAVGVKSNFDDAKNWERLNFNNRKFEEFDVE